LPDDFEWSTSHNAHDEIVPGIDWDNDQCRICFIWYDGDADDVEIVDYHSRRRK
jgi:hypothetical protein